MAGRKIINTKKISHEEWLDLRRKSLGGSDIGAILGMNTYSSALTVYAEKLGLSTPKETSEAMRLGTDLEEYVAKRYEEATGKKVRNDHFMYMDDTYDFMTANIDRRIIGENAGLECKTMNGSTASKYNFEAGEVPGHYYAQCQWYMSILGFDRVDLAILVLQRGIEIVPIKRNDEFIEDMRNEAIDFWTHHIEKEIQPAPDGSDASLDTLKELYPEAEKNTEIAIPGLDALVRDYKAYGELEKEYKEKKQRAQEQICARLGSCEVGIGDDFGCSWKEQSKEYVSPKKLKAMAPDIYSRLVEVSRYRVFRTRTLRKGE